MEPVQIVLLLVIVTLTIVLAILGIQVFLILREIRKTVEKINRVLDNAGVIAKSIADPISALSSLAISIKTGVSFANSLKKIYASLLGHIPHKETKSSSEDRSKKVMTREDEAEELNGDSKSNFPISEDEEKSREDASDAANAGSGSTRPMVRRFFRGIGRKIRV